MRPVAIIGIVLILAGGWVTLNGGSFTTKDTVVDVGGLEVTADHERPIPLWVGIAGIVVGLGLTASGMKRKV